MQSNQWTLRKLHCPQPLTSIPLKQRIIILISQFNIILLTSHLFIRLTSFLEAARSEWSMMYDSRQTRLACVLQLQTRT